ncbi:MAG TPA: DNA translocase FtsK [Bacilli bacterium]|nr:DNA translocase FtsK [Bacilli bacterium]
MSRKSFYIAKIDEENNASKSLDNKQKSPSESKVEGFVSPYYGRKVKDKTTFPYIKYGNQGLQYQGLWEDPRPNLSEEDGETAPVRKNRIPDYLMREDITPRRQKTITPTLVVSQADEPEELEELEQFAFDEENKTSSLDELSELPELNEYFSEDRPKPEAKVVPESKTDLKKTPVLEKTVITYDTKQVKPATFTKKRNRSRYVAPPLNLLKRGQTIKQSDFSGVNYQKEVIDKTLRDFKIGGRVVHYTKGPTVTQFEIKLDDGVKVERVKNISRNLQMNLEGKSIRIEAPIPGKATIGIEVPNIVQDKVFFGELLSNPDYLNDNNPLNVILGLDISGRSVPLDITAMPHALIAGTTGSGKSVCINCIINSIIYKAHPDDVKLVLIDPKLIEFSSYEDIPHLATPVINDPKLATAALKWAVDEMQNRYELFKSCRRRDFNSYNELAATDPSLKEIPYIVIIIDELADLMAVKGKDIEAGIVRVAQMARAVGIHLVIATQRPSVEVITGLIKANITCRVAFQVASQVDSRTILDIAGAEKLIGLGDMLYMSAEYPKPKRIQGPYISEKESKRVLEWIKDNNVPPEFKIDDEILDSLMVGDLGRGSIMDKIQCLPKLLPVIPGLAMILFMNRQKKSLLKPAKRQHRFYNAVCVSVTLALRV